jgi:hypothetical protein
MHRRLFVHRQVIEHHHVPRSQGGHEDLFHIGQEGRIVDRPVEHRGRPEALDPQSGHDRVRLPVAAGRMVVQPHAAQTATIAPQQVRRDAAFIEKDVLAYIAQRLPCLPLPPRGGDIRPTLFVGVYGFF